MIYKCDKVQLVFEYTDLGTEESYEILLRKLFF